MVNKTKPKLTIITADDRKKSLLGFRLNDTPLYLSTLQIYVIYALAHGTEKGISRTSKKLAEDIEECFLIFDQQVYSVSEATVRNQISELRRFFRCKGFDDIIQTVFKRYILCAEIKYESIKTPAKELAEILQKTHSDRTNP